MKPYGIPRLPGNCLGDYGDIGDVQAFARKGSVMRVNGSKPYIRSASERQAVRRIWKKKERKRAKVQIERGLHEQRN